MSNTGENDAHNSHCKYFWNTQWSNTKSKRKTIEKHTKQNKRKKTLTMDAQHAVQMKNKLETYIKHLKQTQQTTSSKWQTHVKHFNNEWTAHMNKQR